MPGATSTVERGKLRLRAGFGVVLVLGGFGGSGIWSPARASVRSLAPQDFTLGQSNSATWAPVARRSLVSSSPGPTARVVMTLSTTFVNPADLERRLPNTVLVLGGVKVGTRATWYRVRLPTLPNNSTGWVRSRDLGPLGVVHTHLYVNTRTLTATLTRNGVVIFESIVGIGEQYWPTPIGQFYIRGREISPDPFYGPVVLPTSGCSHVLLGWPGGPCFIAVQGTNEPSILPGRVSHGEIRLPNAALLRLATLMPIGTPVTIT
jgi:hypothetical protein